MTHTDRRAVLTGMAVVPAAVALRSRASGYSSAYVLSRTFPYSFPSWSYEVRLHRGHGAEHLVVRGQCNPGRPF